MHISPTLDNTNPFAKDLSSTKNYINMNVQKKDQTKPSYYLKVRKPIVKATSSEPIVVVRAFVKTAH